MNLPAAAVTGVPTRKRGRPRAGDPAKISELALELMVRDGYEETTMAQIAAAAGVSEPTLFRYFPTKAAVLWYGMEEGQRRFRSGLRAQPAGRQLADAVFDAYAAMLAETTIPKRIIKLRSMILNRDIETGDMWFHFDEWVVLIAEFVAERRRIEPASFEANLVAEVLWAAIRSGLRAWGLRKDVAPQVVFAEVRRYVIVPD